MGVFSSFKTHIGKALNHVIPGTLECVPTTEDIPSIIAETGPKFMTPIMMSGFRKTWQSFKPRVYS